MTWFQMPCYRLATKKSNLIQSIRVAPQDHDGRNAMGPIHVDKIAGSHCNYMYIVTNLLHQVLVYFSDVLVENNLVIVLKEISEDIKR